MKFGSPPAGSGIQLAEATESRLVMVIPPGGKRARSMGCFALAWLAITIPVGVVFLYASMSGDVEWEGDGAPPVWGVVLFFSIFWSVGFIMGYVALKMKFESLMLCLEPGRLSIQRNFLGRKKISTIQLQEHSQAVLRTSYSENEVPVYRIEIEGAARTEKFGTALELVEKQWIVQTFNRFLGLESPDGESHGSGDRFCAECGTQLMESDGKRICPDCGAIFYDDEESDPEPSRTQVQAPEDVAPEDIPPSSGLVVEDDSGDRLVVSFLLNPSQPIRIVVGGFCCLFAFVWMGVSGYLALSAVVEGGEGSILFALFACVFFSFGFGPLLIGLAVAFGRARIAIDPEWLSVRFHCGPLGWTRRTATDGVQDVLLGENSFVETEVAGVRQNPMSVRMVKVETSGKPLILTLGSKPSISQNLCGVVRYQMHRLGYRLVSDP